MDVEELSIDSIITIIMNYNDSVFLGIFNIYEADWSDGPSLFIGDADFK